MLLLAANSFPIYLRAFKNAFIGVDTKWHVTGTTKKSSAFNFIIPQVLTFVFLLGVSIVSIWRDINLGQLNVATFWSVVNTLAIGAFIGVGFHEAREVQGVADPTDVDLAERVVEDEPSAPLGPDEIVKARRQVQLLASAPAEVATDLLESSAAAIDAAATEPVPAESTPKRAAETAGIN